MGQRGFFYDRLAPLLLTFLGLAVATWGTAESAHGQAGEKRVVMKFDKKRWDAVIEWYVDQTGLPLISSFAPPAGTFTHTPPQGAAYTLPEATAIINESM